MDQLLSSGSEKIRQRFFVWILKCLQQGHLTRLEPVSFVDFHTRRHTNQLQRMIKAPVV